MLDGYLDFFMKPELADAYLRLNRELDEFVQKKVDILVHPLQQIV